MTFFTELKQIILKICMEPQKTPQTKTILRKKNKAGETTLPDFKLHYKVL